MSAVTDRVSRYVKDKGINLKKMSRTTGIPYQALIASLNQKSRTRDLRDDEFIGICQFLGVNPMDFADKSGEVV